MDTKCLKGLEVNLKEVKRDISLAIGDFYITLDKITDKLLDLHVKYSVPTENIENSIFIIVDKISNLEQELKRFGKEEKVDRILNYKMLEITYLGHLWWFNKSNGLPFQVANKTTGIKIKGKELYFSMDGQRPYCPDGGREELQNLIDNQWEELDNIFKYIQPYKLNNEKNNNNLQC